MDPVKECASGNPHVGPTAQQLTLQGPLIINDRRLKVEADMTGFSSLTQTELPNRARNAAASETHPDVSSGASPESPSLHSAHVVMVGVPTEIAVAISVASFLIGAALTGMLCCIHHRKALPKSARHHRGVDDSIEGSEMHSMLSPSGGLTLNGVPVPVKPPDSTTVGSAPTRQPSRPIIEVKA